MGSWVPLGFGVLVVASGWELYDSFVRLELSCAEREGSGGIVMGCNLKRGSGRMG